MIEIKEQAPDSDLSTSYHVTSLKIFFDCSFCSVMPFIPLAPPLPSPTDTSNNTSLPHQHLATKNLENSQIWSEARPPLTPSHPLPISLLFICTFVFSFFYFKFFLLRLTSSTFLVVRNRRKRHFYSFDS